MRPFGKKSAKSTTIVELDGELDLQNVANIMNTYFTTIADKLAEGFPDSPQ